MSSRTTTSSKNTAEATMLVSCLAQPKYHTNVIICEYRTKKAQIGVRITKVKVIVSGIEVRGKCKSRKSIRKYK